MHSDVIIGTHPRFESLTIRHQMQSDAIRCHHRNSPSLRKLDDPPLQHAHARPHTAGWLPLQPLASSAASASPRAPASLGRAAAHSERGPAYVIRGHQRSSEVIRGPQRSSEVLRGHQRSSEVLRGHQRSSEVLRGHQRSSVAYLRRTPREGPRSGGLALDTDTRKPLSTT